MSSRRTLPVHPKLIELGFLKFWESIKTANPLGAVHMFPQLRWESKQMFGRAPSRHIIQLMKNVEVYVTRYKVAHSLRSNFNQALTATQLQADLISIVLGHTNGSMKNERYNMADYGPALPFPLIVEYMSKMEFGLDLKPLEGVW
jgi:integrase